MTARQRGGRLDDSPRAWGLDNRVHHCALLSRREKTWFLLDNPGRDAGMGGGSRWAVSTVPGGHAAECVSTLESSGPCPRGDGFGERFNGGVVAAELLPLLLPLALFLKSAF